jgi:hypothetical protein
MKEASTDLDKLREQIMGLKYSAKELQTCGKDIPAITCNIARILASVKMLELNIVDVANLCSGD